MVNMQMRSCSAVLDKLPAFSFQPLCLKYGRELDIFVGPSSKGKLLCPLPHCGVEITAGTCAGTDVKLQASVHALQSEACRQQDWHDVP